MTSRDGSANGSGRRRMPRTTLKIAVFAPMPIASVNAATSVKPGERRSVRTAKETSWVSSLINSLRIVCFSRWSSCRLQ